ncbi:MAG: hypothetical protein LC798_02975 [Chloroflexi bacterium]|nr:hypothetical protein [Chloroflexota bacterium]
MTIHTCANPTDWHPTLHTIQRHHQPPLSWRRAILNYDPEADQSWWRVIPLCGLDHDEYHTLLNAYARADGTPPYAELRTYGLFVRALVAEAWARGRVPGQRMPWTAST